MRRLVAIGAASVVIAAAGISGCSARERMGTGPEVAASIERALQTQELPDGSGCAPKVQGEQCNDPVNGRLVYRWWPADAGKFTPSRLVIITITPWDNDPCQRRTVAISATRYHYFPPFIALPAGDAVASVTAAIDAAHDAGPKHDH